MILVTSYIHLQYSPPVKRGNIRQNFPEQGRARVQLVSPDVLRVREDWQFPSSWLCSTSGLDWFAVQTSSGASCLPDAGLGGYWLPVICPSVAESSDWTIASTTTVLSTYAGYRFYAALLCAMCILYLDGGSAVGVFLPSITISYPRSNYVLIFLNIS